MNGRVLRARDSGAGPSPGDLGGAAIVGLQVECRRCLSARRGDRARLAFARFMSRLNQALTVRRRSPACMHSRAYIDANEKCNPQSSIVTARMAPLGPHPATAHSTISSAMASSVDLLGFSVLGDHCVAKQPPRPDH
jgi:hypothetical protein